MRIGCHLIKILYLPESLDLEEDGIELYFLFLIRGEVHRLIGGSIQENYRAWSEPSAFLLAVYEGLLVYWSILFSFRYPHWS